MSLEQPYQRPVFNSAKLPVSPSQYVGWIDAMGIQSAMGRSMDAAANFIFKLHITVLQSVDALPSRQRKSLDLYPVMDGVYFVTSDQQALYTFLRRVFRSLAEEFNGTTEMRHRFLVRGALACGPVVHGRELTPEASAVLQAHPTYRDSILLGLPMIQAYLTERMAPPFSVYVHESARAFAPDPFEPIRATWWRWFRASHNDQWLALASKLHTELGRYFDWCKNRSSEINYEIASIEKHKQLAKEYFTDVEISGDAFL